MMLNKKKICFFLGGTLCALFLLFSVPVGMAAGYPGYRPFETEQEALWRMYGVSAEDAELTPRELVAKWTENGCIDEYGGVKLGMSSWINPLHAIWTIFGYPDDVGAMFYDNDTGLYGFSVINPTPGRIAELRELAIADVVIVTGVYSWNEMNLVRDEIAAMMGHSHGLYSAGIGSAGVIRGFGESGKESRVVVRVEESELRRYRAEFARRYGDIVYVYASGPAILLDGTSVDGTSGDMRWWVAASAAGFALLLASAIFVFIRHRKRPS
jgi:hypothetical protein